MKSRFDAVIVGAGQAGPSLATRLTKAGWKIAFVERGRFGGTCVNTGCTPTKAMVASAFAAQMARRANEYGLNALGPVTVDMAAVKARKDAIVAKSRTGVEQMLREMDGCTVFSGTARFVSPRQLQVGDDVLEAEKIFLNVGARPHIPDLAGAKIVPFLTSSTILELTEVPKHLIVVGGSYIGLEFGQMFRRFGAEVTIVERKSRLLAREDEDVSKAVEEILKAEGITLRLDASCIHLEQRGSEVVVGMECATGHAEVVGTHILLALGRQPNTDDLNLAGAGLKSDEAGFIEVDDQLRTNVPGIWAMGDCNGRGAFTHTAYNDYEIVAANLLDNDPRRVSDRISAHAVYIDPPLAQVGMTEAEVRQSGRPALIGTRPMTRVNRAIEKGETQGFMKVLVDAESRQILGAMILGVGGDEAIHSILTAMYAKAPDSVVARSMPIHPTLSELIPTVFEDLKPLE